MFIWTFSSFHFLGEIGSQGLLVQWSLDKLSGDNSLFISQTHNLRKLSILPAVSSGVATLKAVSLRNKF